MYCTTGTLLRKMQDDPLLNDVSHLILDEIHERNIETDLLLVILKKIHQYRPSLKIILMSATFSFEKFAKYFHECQIIDIKGSLFPVEERYLEDVIEETRFNKFPNSPQPQGYRKHLVSIFLLWFRKTLFCDPLRNTTGIATLSLMAS